MNYLWLIPYYISWHYTRAFKELWYVWGNFFYFLSNFFSMSLLARTLFQPFERLGEKYKGNLDVQNFLATMFINLMMRLVGFFARAFILVLGLVAHIMLVIVGALAFILWLFVPLILGILLVLGVAIVFGFNVPVL